MYRALLATVCAFVCIAGCGSSTPAPEEAPAAAGEPAAAEPVTEASAETPEAASGEKSAPADSTGKQADPDTAEREVTYLQTPEGLKVDVSGVRFSATATPVKVGGGWGLKLSVQATSRDGKSHKLLSPKNGPMAFGGKVERAGKAEDLTDAREGEELRVVPADKPLEFSREWPGKGGAKPLLAGDSLELQVGLWGVGDDEESQRPLRHFLLVKMVAGKKKPQPVVSPPPSASH